MSHSAAFSDGAGAGGFLKDLLHWWRTLADVGQRYGYFVNPPKTWLVVKEKHYQAATSLFGALGSRSQQGVVPCLEHHWETLTTTRST